MATRQYDPSQVIFNVGGRDVFGFADGSFIEVDRNADAVETKVGSDGEVTRVMSANRSGNFKCVLQQSSPLNDYFSSLATQDEKTKDAIVTVFLKDGNGTTLALGAKSWIKKKAKVGFETSSANREWMFETGQLDFDIGGETEL